MYCGYLMRLRSSKGTIDIAMRLSLHPVLECSSSKMDHTHTQAIPSGPPGRNKGRQIQQCKQPL